MAILTNRLGTQRGTRLVKTGRVLTKPERAMYGKSAMLRYAAGTGEPIYPIGYVKHKNPMGKKRAICCYTAEGRKGLHDNLRVNATLMMALMRQPSAQWGRCAVTGAEFQMLSDIHCHHKVMRQNGESDKYENLVLILEPVHKLIHATEEETIGRYLKRLNLDKDQMVKLNKLRQKVGNAEIVV